MKKIVRKTEHAIAVLIRRLYGQKNYGEFKSHQNLTKTKKYYLKLIDSFSHSINETIQVVDKHQLQSLKDILDRGKNLIRTSFSFHELDQSFVAIQSEFIFQLIGQVPSRSSRMNVTNRKENWKLNNYRQIQYVQNKKNKELLIFKIIRERHLTKFGEIDDFYDLYSRLDKDIDNLLEYLRINYPDVYVDL